MRRGLTWCVWGALCALVGVGVAAPSACAQQQPAPPTGGTGGADGALDVFGDVAPVDVERFTLDARKRALGEVLGPPNTFSLAGLGPFMGTLGLSVVGGVAYAAHTRGWPNGRTTRSGVRYDTLGAFTAAGAGVFALGGGVVYGLGDESRWVDPLVRASLYAGIATAMLGLGVGYQGPQAALSPEYHLGSKRSHQLSTGIIAGTFYAAAAGVLIREAHTPSLSHAQLNRQRRALHTPWARDAMTRDQVEAIEATLEGPSGWRYAWEVIPFGVGGVGLLAQSVLDPDEANSANGLMAVVLALQAMPGVMLWLVPSQTERYHDALRATVSVSPTPGGLSLHGRF